MFIGLFIVLGLSIALCLWITQPLIFATKVKKSAKVESEKLKNHVEKISNEFYPRNFFNQSNLNKTADYIKTEFEKTGAKVSEQNYRIEGRDYRNIIAIFGNESNERTVIGAHYDSCGETVGADDNASGVAGLIELAHLLGKEKSSQTVELVAYTLEEPPYFATNAMGSHVHAKSLKEKDIKVRLMISLEMIGYFQMSRKVRNFLCHSSNFFIRAKVILFRLWAILPIS